MLAIDSMARRKARTVGRQQWGQRGYGAQFPVFRGTRYQRGGAWYPVFPSSHRPGGAGLGGIFRGLFRTVAPHLKKGLVHVGKRALTEGALADVSENKMWLKDALKKQAKSELKALNPINMMKGVALGVVHGRGNTRQPYHHHQRRRRLD